MTHACCWRAGAVFLMGFAIGCGGSRPPEPSHAEERAKRDAARQQEADAARAKASRIARLETDEPKERMPDAVVQVSFEPLVTGVRPGRKFLLAAHFRIAPGYRISWQNAGDVGKETVVTFRGPPGFEVGTATFPVPERFAVPGGYVGYGYQDETAVFVEVKAPAALRGVHRFDLSASWVACKKECATERTDAFVELATTHGAAAAKEVEARLSPFKARLPTPLTDVEGAEQKWELEGHRATLVVTIPGTEPREFWPGATAEPAPKKVAMSGAEIRFAFAEKPGPDARPVRGIVIASEGGKDAFFDLVATSSDAKAKKAKRAQRKKAAARRRRR